MLHGIRRRVRAEHRTVRAKAREMHRQSMRCWRLLSALRFVGVHSIVSSLGDVVVGILARLFFTNTNLPVLEYACTDLLFPPNSCSSSQTNTSPFCTQRSHFNPKSIACSSTCKALPCNRAARFTHLCVFITVRADGTNTSRPVLCFVLFHRELFELKV